MAQYIFLLCHISLSSNLYQYLFTEYCSISDAIIRILHTKTPLGTNSPKPNQTNLLSISIYILGATGSVVLILCLSVGLTAVCIWRAALVKKHVRSKSPTDSSSGEYDDIVGPGYETITTSGNSARDTKVLMTENEAYKTIRFKVTKFASLEVDLTNNEGNHKVGTNNEGNINSERAPTLICMQKNSSYQTTVPQRSLSKNTDPNSPKMPSSL